MSDESNPITAVAKAAEETAKTGRALIEPGTDLAKYIARVLGTVPEDVVGFLVGDPLHELRQHTLIGILRAAFEKLRARGVETAKPIRPGPGKEAFEAASLETDETLQDMWATLLANAMDPGKDTSLQRVFIVTLKEFEPIDARILQEIAQSPGDGVLNDHQLVTQLTIRDTQVFLSVEKLIDLKVLRIKGASAPRRYTPAPLGRELYRACTGNVPG
jgi:hypothetical protein